MRNWPTMPGPCATIDERETDVRNATGSLATCAGYVNDKGSSGGPAVMDTFFMASCQISICILHKELLTTLIISNFWQYQCFVTQRSVRCVSSMLCAGLFCISCCRVENVSVVSIRSLLFDSGPVRMPSTATN